MSLVAADLTCACEFNDFWNDGWTPKHLLKGDANVYKQIAMALKPGEWRNAGLVTVLEKMRTFDGERKIIKVDASEPFSPSQQLPIPVTVDGAHASAATLGAQII
jgi:hypothetical protein